MIQRDYKADLATAHIEIRIMEKEIARLKESCVNVGKEVKHLRDCIRDQASDKVEIAMLKATAEELNDALGLMGRDRDYWHDQATRGGGNS